MPRSPVVPSPSAIAPMVHWIRREKVILDFDLAALYGVETRALKKLSDATSGVFRTIFFLF